MQDTMTLTHAEHDAPPWLTAGNLWSAPSDAGAAGGMSAGDGEDATQPTRPAGNPAVLRRAGQPVGAPSPAGGAVGGEAALRLEPSGNKCKWAEAG